MVFELDFQESVKLDQNRLAEIIARLGPRGADELISKTMEELAVLLAQVHKSLTKGHANEVQVTARKISEVAAHVGMPTLSVVSQAVSGIAARDDPAGMAALSHRLTRVGEESLMTVWDLQDLSM